MTSGFLFTAEEELGACFRIGQNLLKLVQTGQFDVAEVVASLLHIEGRLGRIEPQTDEEAANLLNIGSEMRELKECIDKMIADGNTKGAIQKKSLQRSYNQVDRQCDTATKRCEASTSNVG